MNHDNKKVVTRFAPSPTGFMHVGGVRTALYAWAWARKNNGTFILRIEDTDKAREVEGSIPHIIESLKWLGITWDEGVDIGGPHAPYIQSQRLDSYKKYAQILIDKGYAYADPYTEDEVALFRTQAESEKRAFLYRDHRPETTIPWDGTKPLRFKVPEVKSYTWHDAVRGELTAGEEALDDFILIKSDGYPTYNFAHIIDDLEMEVTHIMRSDEFIASTPKFLSLYDALGISHPTFVTLPPILAPEGNKKLGKRDGAKDILDYRNEGFLPEAMMNFLALLGWNPGGDKEIMTQQELVELFDITKIHKSGAMFNEEKLLWMNKEHIRALAPVDKKARVQEALPLYPETLVEKLYPYVIDRISCFGEIAQIEKEEFAYLVKAPQLGDGFDIKKIEWKDAGFSQALIHLHALRVLLETADYTSPETIKSLIMPYAEEHGKGNVLWPLRMTLSGKEKSIDPFTLCYLLGKEEALARIDAISLMSTT